MNTPRDPWLDFADVFAEELKAQAAWTDEMREAARLAYEMEQVITAQSEAAFAANVKEYNK